MLLSKTGHAPQLRTCHTISDRQRLALRAQSNVTIHSITTRCSTALQTSTHDRHTQNKRRATHSYSDDARAPRHLGPIHQVSIMPSNSYETSARDIKGQSMSLALSRETQGQALSGRSREWHRQHWVPGLDISICAPQMELSRLEAPALLEALVARLVCKQPPRRLFHHARPAAAKTRIADVRCGRRDRRQHRRARQAGRASQPEALACAVPNLSCCRPCASTLLNSTFD